MSFKDNLGLSMCIGVLCCCIFTLGQLVMFLSSHAPLRQNRYPPFIYFGHFDSLWLQILIDLCLLWHPTPGWVVWEISTAAHPTAWWLFAAIHCIAWLVIYGSCFVIDITELLGAKQVFYSLQGWPDPLSLKSEGLQRMYSHMRHPSFSALAVLLFAHPLMQLDRLLLAYALVLHQLLGWRVDAADYSYQRRMLQRKERDLCCS
ncbi:nurim homolog [Caerostris extrusa]|uniref:Nuclear envelope membrane protein n=1 Tax=Caerostris extrusa TaxID=172846 RepID=A0AAV4NTQ7_CAEEX|nr:nurim homolog [Caerostris extrusa]